MYTSQSMLILALLLLLTAALFYNTIDFQRRQIIEEMRATSVDLKSSSIEHVVSSSISSVFSKVLNNASLKVANEGFFDSPEEVIEYLENNTENCINNYLDNISRYYSDQGYNFTYFFHITNITMVDGFTFKISYIFNYTLSYNGTINKTENINSSQYVTVKTILDAYHYRKPTYIMPIYIYNPNNYDLKDFQVNITLNNSNFIFSIDPNGTGLRFVYNNTYIPYWIEYWNYTNDGIKNDKAIIWIKVPELKAHKNTTIYLASTYPKISESNGDSVFELFDDFENSSGTKWNILYGSWRFNNSNYPLYNDLYNRQVIECEDAPPVARIISTNYTNLSSYIIEVVARGDNDYTSSQAPNIMVGYFADPQYYWLLTVHPDAFYTFDLGGRFDLGEGYGRRRGVWSALWSDYIDLYWTQVAQISREVMVCEEYPYPYDIKYIYRTRVDYNNITSPERGTWYLIKILITEKEVNGIKVKEVKGTYTPLEDYIKYNIENPWMIDTIITNPYGRRFELGTSWGDHNDSHQYVYFDNFRVRKYAPIEPKVYVSGKITRIYPLIYISPDRAYGTHYGEGVSYNPYFVEDPLEQYPSIVDMLAGRNTKEYGYSIKLTGLPISED
ncbi:DUF2341 domain-containing protein [Methanofervidicoccus abyssi]|uniref:DUF2341 domain-containing protein n=1 Tax=Methanofervidicoccus abyssi TaxID=2082189 RepID=A0A401HQ96_9EURY|nr:DUF2341 domain-containing protein [Methanofervidicoccus abyssi]GBF36428.1 hypothetical protein MHHB_P0658 [Methanofervidicoccus abyssi]